jgi:hypothetical protein
MIVPNPELVEKLMRTAGRISGTDAFPFNADEVNGIHTFKHGEGYGVWFHLKDGRVFNSAGQPSETDVTKYGETRAQLVWSR